MIELPWFTDLIPEEFVLETRMGAVLPPVYPVVAGEKEPQRFWNSHWDWDWRYLDAFHVQKGEDIWGPAVINLDRFPVNEPYWLAHLDSFGEAPPLTWVQVEGEIAKMVLTDFIKKEPFKYHTLLLISSSGKHFGSYRGPFVDDYLFSNSPWAKDLSYYNGNARVHRWAKWSKVIFERHPDIWDPYGFEKIMAYEDDSFFSFCVEVWRDYVFDKWYSGTDEEVLHAMETVRLLDEGNDSDAQYLTIWDDLAIEFFRSEKTTKFIERMYKLLDDPMDLDIDLTTSEGMKMYREKARKRDQR
jgi:hypothetical protein